MIGILQQERNWEESIEEALHDAGMEADRGKREPALLIRKMNERIKKKKEKITSLKARYDNIFLTFCVIFLFT